MTPTVTRLNVQEGTGGQLSPYAKENLRHTTLVEARPPLCWPVKYVAVTAAHNEEEYICATIRSISSQTILPAAWLIVDDGSTDSTAEVVLNYGRTFPWIRLALMAEHHRRTFAAKARCINFAIPILATINFDVIVCVDADVTFEPGYLEFVLRKFVEDPCLGVAGTPFVEGTYASHGHAHANYADPPGQCQCLRRECFESVGGYRPLEHGGEDTVAAVLARIQGWHTRTYPGMYFRHERRTCTAGRGLFSASFHVGVRDGVFRNRALWEVVRIGRHSTLSPYVVRGIALAFGYAWARTAKGNRQIPSEVIEWRRDEQACRLRELLLGLLNGVTSLYRRISAR